MVIVLWVVILIMGSVAANGSTIFPNVKVNGVSVGGMSQTEAAETISAEADDYSDNSIIIRLPDDQTKEITSLQVGLTPTADEASAMAFEYGRRGNIFSNSIKYFRCLIGMGLVDLNENTGMLLNEERLYEIISEMTEEINKDPVQPSYQSEGETLYITRGTAGMTIDQQELYDLVSQAFLTADFEEIQYETHKIQPDDVDLQAIYDSVHVEPKNSIYDKSTGAVTEDVKGISFDIESAQLTVDTAPNGETAEVPLIITQPDVTTEDLNQLLFSALLSSKSTTLTNNSNRNNNIQLAASALSGYVINPGERFSFNDVVGQRTESRGFLPAGAYSNGQTVTEVGGGICQVSSTIYYTVLMSNLEVVNRLPHTFTVSYLPLGMDATVSWGGPEFIFANNTDYPIKINAWRDGLTLNIEIYGTKTDEYTYSLESRTTSTIAYSTEYVDDGSLPAGSSTVTTAGHIGYTVDTFRLVYDGSGNLVREEKVNTSSYSKLNEVITRGTG